MQRKPYVIHCFSYGPHFSYRDTYCQEIILNVPVLTHKVNIRHLEWIVSTILWRLNKSHYLFVLTVRV